MNSGKFMLMIILNYLHNTNSLVATNGLMVTNHLVVAICLVSTNRLVARRPAFMVKCHIRLVFMRSLVLVFTIKINSLCSIHSTTSRTNSLMTSRTNNNCLNIHVLYFVA
jgi:hypothetical protein